MHTPESAFGPACFPGAELPAVSTEVVETDWGRFAANVFIRVSRQTPASVPAQAAGVALAVQGEGIPPAGELEVAFRADRALVSDVADIANRVHERTRPNAEEVRPSGVEGVVFSVFTLAGRLNRLLDPSEFAAVRDHFAPLAGKPEEYIERMAFECKLDVLAACRTDGVSRSPEMTTSWLLDSSIDVL